MNTIQSISFLSICATAAFAAARDVPDSVIDDQRAALAANTEGQGFGPQSPRDIDRFGGRNQRQFGDAPRSRNMNLCNIHFHKNAEHRGGEFTTYAGNGDGMGFGTGYVFDGQLGVNETEPVHVPICDGPNGGLVPGDTIELHYVYSSAKVEPGPGLGACVSPAIINPQLRVEAQVYVVVNDRQAASFIDLTAIETRRGYFQAVNIPRNTGFPVQYTGSTTGPTYNTEGSPLQVSWSVRPKVQRVDILTVGQWCNHNAFAETTAQGVRNLVTNRDLLSRITY